VPFSRIFSARDLQVLCFSHNTHAFVSLVWGFSLELGIGLALAFGAREEAKGERPPTLQQEAKTQRTTKEGLFRARFEALSFFERIAHGFELCLEIES
jgi:hypothetical protein